MSWLSRLKALILTKSEKPQAKPTGFLTQPKPVNVAIEEPKIMSFTVAPPKKKPMKVNFLRLVAKILLLLNIAVGVFFYSNNWYLNGALWGYLFLVTVIMGHYLSVTR